jgi:hypothetical protein
MSTACLEPRSDVVHLQSPRMYPAPGVPVDDPGAQMYVVGVLAAAGAWLDLPDTVRAEAAAAAGSGVSIGLRAEVLLKAAAAGRATLPQGQARRLADAGVLAQKLAAR